MTKKKANPQRKPRMFAYNPENRGLRTFSDRLAINLMQLRKQKGLTQTDLAAHTNLPQQVISYFESGWANPTLSNLVRLAGYFDVPIAKLFKQKDKISYLLAEELLVERVKLRKFDSWRSGIAGEKNLIVSVHIGTIIILSDEHGRLDPISSDKKVVIPGGGEVAILPLSPDGAEFTIIECIDLN